MLPCCKSVAAGAALLAIGACAAPKSSDLAARATGEWTRSYPIETGGEVQITNADGPVHIEASDGSTVEVRAERTVHAFTEESARDVLTRVEIGEEVSPSRVAIRTQPLGGIVIGVRVEVSYHVTAPKTVLVRARSSRGGVTVNGFAGRVIANSINGRLNISGQSGGLEARVTNGSARIALAALGDGAVDIRSVNGSIDLIVPETAAANVQASVINGGFDVAGLKFEPMSDNTPRRFRGRINDGGTPLELSATNGRIRIASPSAVAPAEAAPGAESPPNRP
jgi:hypothetical protein